MNTEEKFLREYREQDYEKLSCTTDILIFTIGREHQLQVLLKKRRQLPFRGRWALPGGVVGIRESLEDSARRVLLEKTGLSRLHLEQLYTFGQPDRDSRMRFVSAACLALLP